MDETTSTPPPTSVGYGGGQTTALFLSLYLLVLAFFIVLVSISSFEEVKSKAVMNSLTSTFSSLLPPTTDLTIFSSKEGQMLAGQAFQEQITGIFATDIQIAKVEVVQPGRLMRVTMDAYSLNMPATTEIREAQMPLLDRVVASLSANTPGLRYDLEFIIGSPYAKGKDLPIGETLETSRAGAFARALLARGAPPANIAVGIEPSDPGKIVMRFFTRTEDEVRLQFQAAEKKAASTGTEAP